MPSCLMTRSELIARLSRRFPRLLQQDAQIAVDLILDAIAKSLIQQRRAEIRGFGSFTLHYRPSKQARNPRTGEPVAVAGKFVPHFKPGKTLRQTIQPATTTEPAA